MTASPTFQAAKRDDQPTGDPAGGGVSLTHLLGTWINTYRETSSILTFRLQRSGSGYAIEAQCSSAHGLTNLGVVEVRPFAANVISTTADGFTATYDLGFLEML